MSALVGEIELSPENGFELSLRGYHRGQVDRYVATLQMRLTTLETELASARYREQQLDGRVERLGVELQNCTCGDEGTSKVVGGRIHRMIQLAEEEAAALREQAKLDLEHAQASSEALLTEARQHAEEAMRDFQTALTQRRSEEARAEAARRAQWDARRLRQREAAEGLLAATRSASAEGLTVTRKLLDALAEQHASLTAEVESAEKALADLSAA